MKHDENLKNRIKEVRKKSNYTTQKTFSTYLGTTRPAIASYELGRVEPSDTFIQLLCAKFNVSVDWLCFGIGDMYEESEAAYVASLCEQYNMSPEQKKIMEIFLSMSEEKRDAVSKAFFDFLYSAKKVDAVEVSNSVGEVGNSVGEVADSDVDDADQAAIDAEAEAYRQELIAEKKAASHSDDGSEHTGA